MNALRRAVLGLCALLFFAVSAFVCLRVAERGRFTGAYSSYGAGPRGTRALYLLTEQLGLAPARWAQDLAALPDEGGVLVALGACDSGMARPLSRYEDQELVDWVKRGGVLLVGGARDYIPAQFGVAFAAEADCEPAWNFSANQDTDPLDDDPAEAAPDGDSEASDAGAGRDAGAVSDAGVGAQAPRDGALVVDGGNFVWTVPVDDLLNGIEAILMQDPGQLVIAPKADARVLIVLPPGLAPSQALSTDAAGTDGEREAGVVVRYGKGSVIALASASMLQNQTLAASDGGVLFARLLAAYGGRGPVLFDEYHLGVGERRSLMRYLRQVGALPYLAQLIGVALLLLWRAGARFGGVREPDDIAPAVTTSFVSALGALFVRTGDAPSTARILGRQALARVAAHHHLSPSAADALARELAGTGRVEAADAVRDIAALQAKGTRDARGLATTSHELDQAVARACRAP